MSLNIFALVYICGNVGYIMTLIIDLNECIVFEQAGLSKTPAHALEKYIYLWVRAFFHKTFRVYHVYCNFILSYTCRILLIFGTPKDAYLLINIFTSNHCFSNRNIFQNGVNALLKLDDAFLTKSWNFYNVRIIR